MFFQWSGYYNFYPATATSHETRSAFHSFNLSTSVKDDILSYSNYKSEPSWLIILGLTTNEKNLVQSSLHSIWLCRIFIATSAELKKRDENHYNSRISFHKALTENKSFKNFRIVSVWAKNLLVHIQSWKRA